MPMEMGNCQIQKEVLKWSEMKIDFEASYLSADALRSAQAIVIYRKQS